MVEITTGSSSGCQTYPANVMVTKNICILRRGGEVLNAADGNRREAKLKADRGNKNWVAIFALVSTGFSAITMLLLFIVLGNVISIAKKPAPSLVQMNNGQAIRVKAIGSKERSLDVVQSFTTDALTMLMSWTNELPIAKGEAKSLDKGFTVKTKTGEQLITMSTFQASFVFADGLRDEMVKILAEMTPPDVFKGNIRTALKFQHVTIPVQVEEGKWRIKVIGTLLKYQPGRGDTTRVSFNKEIVVAAIDTPEQLAGGTISNEITAVVNNIRQAGLEIVSMKDIEGNEESRPATGTSPAVSPAPTASSTK
jgi:hypothetical protein